MEAKFQKVSSNKTDSLEYLLLKKSNLQELRLTTVNNNINTHHQINSKGHFSFHTTSSSLPTLDQKRKNLRIKLLGRNKH